MQGEKDNEIFKIQTDRYEIAVLTDIGDRTEQQDSYGFEIGEKGALITVCDGMGGYRGGRRASRLAVKTILDEYKKTTDGGDPIEFLQGTTKKADRAVSSLLGDDGEPFEGGSTMITLLLYMNYLFWNSVGDSRIYLFRNMAEYVQLTQDQNYRTVINEQRRTGVISEIDYKIMGKKADALINYIGIGNIELIDYNVSPLLVRKHDRILLTTDGLYRLIEDKEIAEIICNYGDITEALEALAYKVKRRAMLGRYKRDNMTMVLVNAL